MTAQFQFVMRSGPNTGKIFPLETPEVIIGRETNSGIAIIDAEVSRKHAQLTLHGSAYVIQDLGSTNGTFINGQRLTSSQVLNPGDSVSLGENIVLLYEAAYDPNATVVASGQVLKAAPIPKPAAPSSSAPTPPQTFSGQVPAGPIPQPALPKKKKKFPIWLIFLILLLLVICVCVVFFVVIDQFNLWCQILPFLVPFLGGSCT